MRAQIKARAHPIHQPARSRVVPQAESSMRPPRRADGEGPPRRRGVGCGTAAPIVDRHPRRPDHRWRRRGRAMNRLASVSLVGRPDRRELGRRGRRFLLRVILAGAESGSSLGRLLARQVVSEHRRAPAGRAGRRELERSGSRKISEQPLAGARIRGWMNNRTWSTRSCSISWWTSAPLPSTAMSPTPRDLSSATAASSSPGSTSAPSQSRSVRVRLATYLGVWFSCLAMGLSSGWNGQCRHLLVGTTPKKVARCVVGAGGCHGLMDRVCVWRSANRHG